MTETGSRCGFVAVVGPPNAGKSTLTNAMVGSKVSIVTHKVQTTRGRVAGIRTADRDQIVFVDTPGIFNPDRRLERALVNTAWNGAIDADLILLVVDARKGMARDTVAILDGLRGRRRRAFCAINKIDTVSKKQLLPVAAELDGAGMLDGIHYVSALDGDGVEDLVAALRAHLPAGPWLFPEDQISDLPMRMLAAEITREKLFLRVHQELPYELSVETELWTETGESDAVRIDQVVYVAKDNHKPMLLGKGGRTIRSVSMAARLELQRILERPVHLFVHVKVRSNWLDDPARYRAIGLDYPG